MILLSLLIFYPQNKITIQLIGLKLTSKQNTIQLIGKYCLDSIVHPLIKYSRWPCLLFKILFWFLKFYFVRFDPD
jgi:hypothetical protein